MYIHIQTPVSVPGRKKCTRNTLTVVISARGLIHKFYQFYLFAYTFLYFINKHDLGLTLDNTIYGEREKLRERFLRKTSSLEKQVLLLPKLLPNYGMDGCCDTLCGELMSNF